MAEQELNNETQATESTEPEKKYTDADVDAIIDKKFAKWKNEQEKAVAEAVAKVEEAHKLAAMNDKEKNDYETEAMKKELAELKAEKARNSMMATARSMLDADGVKVPEELLTVLVSDNAESTNNAVKAFSGMFQTAVNEAVKKKLAGSEPRRGSAAAAMTKEEILKIENPVERRKAISENLELFGDMLNGGNK